MMPFYNSTTGINNFSISFSKNPQQDFGVFAKGYTRAASILAETLLSKPPHERADYEIYPVVFLYRQAFELYLKSFYYRSKMIAVFIGNQDFENSPEINNLEKDFKRKFNIHKLTPFAKIFREACKVLFPSDGELSLLAEKANQFAEDYEKIDFESFAYRYPVNTSGKISTRVNQLVDLLALHQSMQELLTEFENVSGFLDAEAYRSQEVYESNEKNKLNY